MHTEQRILQKCHVLSEGKLNNIGVQMVIRQRKSSHSLAAQSGMSKISVLKILKLCPYEITPIQQLLPLDC